MSKEEQVMKLLQEIMAEKGSGGNIQLGNFVIKQEEPTSPEIPSNNFIKDMFQQLDGVSPLDNFIEDGNESFVETNKSCILSRQSSAKQIKKEVNQKVFPKVYQVLKKFQEPQIQTAIEEALNDDFEQIYKHTISESSNTHLSLDTKTTLTDNLSSDPLKAFLISLLPQPSIPSPPVYQKSKIDFLFLYSQPLIQLPHKKIIPQLETIKEREIIVDVLKMDQTDLKFMTIPARVDLFGEALDLMPKALHYCGHGIYADHQSQLVFESLNGSASLISMNSIKTMLSKLTEPIKFVFVATCHSKLIGEIFSQAGADHVICVNTTEKIMDEVCRVFARAFYHAVLRGTKTICEAFQIAKDQVKIEGRFPQTEENKFVLLKKENLIVDHQCTQWNLKPGKFVDISRQAKYSHTLPGQVSHYQGRQIQMQELIEKILKNNIITVKGILGIGKSALVKQTACYISERMIFRDGVVYLNLSQNDSFDTFTGILSQIVLPQQQLVQSKSEMKQLIITQLVQALKNQELLIVLDNCDLLACSYDSDVFVQFLDLLLSNCNRLNLCLSCRMDIIQRGKSMRIEGLSNEESVQLFLNHAQREISLQEIQEFLQLKDTMIEEKFLYSKLGNHDFFNILNGHPQAIKLTAGLVEVYSLKELYKQLTTKQLVDISGQGFTLEEQRTLKLSLELSYNNLQERNEKAALFFAFLGLFPVGLTSEDLDQVYVAHWEPLKNQLLKSSLLMTYNRKNKVYYQLHPFMMQFAAEELEKRQYKLYQRNIIKYYTKKMQQIYHSVGTQLGESNQHVEYFLLIEPNIKWTIIREFKELSDESFVLDSITTKSSTRKNSDSDFKRKTSQNEDEEDDKDFNLPLTKENLEIMQKRYEQQNIPQKNNKKKQQFLTNSVISTVKFDQVSDEQRYSTMTENVRRRKSMSNYQWTQITISEEIELSGQDEEQIDIPQVESHLIKHKQIDSIAPSNKMLFSDNTHQQDLKSSLIQDNIKSQPVPNKKQNQKKQLTFNDQIQQKQLQQQQNRAKSYRSQKEQIVEKGGVKKYEEIKKDKLQKLILYYCQTLLLIRQYNECLKFIQWAIKLLTIDNEQIFLANLLKTKACVFYMQKKEQKSKQTFKQAKELFIKKGCSLGVGCCEAGLGYICLQQRELQQAKVAFENALVFYDNLNHDFGRHFLNRWLLLVKSKISSLKNDRQKHIEDERQLIDTMKQEIKKGIKLDNLIQKKHKGGTFILRWLGDTISMFIEPAWVQDSKQKQILNFLKNVDTQIFRQKQQQEKQIVVFEQNDFQEVKQTSSSASSTTSYQLKMNQKKGGKMQKLNKIAEVEDRSEDENQQKQKKSKKSVMPCFKKSQTLNSNKTFKI